MITRKLFLAAARAVAHPPNPPPIITKSAASSLAPPFAIPMNGTKIKGAVIPTLLINARRLIRLPGMLMHQVRQKIFARVNKLTVMAINKVMVRPLQKPSQGVTANFESSQSPPVNANTGAMKLLMPA